MDAAADRAQEALASSWDVRSIGRARGGSRTTPLTERRWAHAVDSHWHLSTTVRCQHRCIYCYEGDRTGFHDVPLKDAKRLVSLAAAEVPMVLFLGAEPTLNPHMPELIRHAVRLGLRAGISTNALCLADWGYLEELHRAGLDLVEFSFSYPDAETYAKITGAAPANYVRLLRAVENLARWQETLGRSRSGGLFPNIVVNGYTIDRLEDTLRQLTRRLTPGRFILTLLRLHTAPHAQPEPLRRELYVPCSVLRERLPRFAAHAAAGVPVSFSQFPLCTIPGWEAVNNELSYWLNGVRVKQNLFDPKKAMLIPMDDGLKAAHPFRWVCETCGLSPLCLDRGLFAQADLKPEHAPQPWSGPLPPGLAAWVRGQKRGRAALRRRPGRTALGWALAQLLARVPTHRPGPGGDLRWYPLDRGVVMVEGARRRMACLLERAAGGRFRLAHQPLAGDSVWARPMLGALSGALRRCPPAPRACLPEPASGGGTEGTGVQEPAAPPPLDGQEAVPAWFRRLVEGELRRRVATAARQAPGFRNGRVECSGHRTLRLLGPGAAERGEVVFGLPAGPRSLGSLAGPLRLRLTWSGSRESARLWVEALQAACDGLEDSPGWPARSRPAPDSFLSRVWRLFGRTLGPRVGPKGEVLAGWVDEQGIQVELLAVGEKRLRILLTSERDSPPPYARGRGICLYYEGAEASVPDGGWKRTVDCFARILKPT